MWKNTLVFSVAFILFQGSSSLAAEEPEEAVVSDLLSITYVGNEGFLLESGGRKVLIDALVGDYHSQYVELNDSIRLPMEKGEVPFDQVDLVLATHYHADHFGVESIHRFLEKNWAARFVGPEQAVEGLRALKGVDSQVALRIQGITPEEGGRIGLQALKVEIFNFHHGRYRDPLVENNAYIIHLGNWTILHVGDTEITEREIAVHQLEKESIDLVMAPSWFLSPREDSPFEEWWNTLQRIVAPKFVTLMHLPPAWSSASKSKGIRNWLGDQKTRPSELLLFQEALESQVLGD